MSYSGKSIKYRVGDTIQECSLYTSTSDRVSTSDQCVAVVMDNVTRYLIAVHPANFKKYNLSSVSEEIGGVTYRIAKSKITPRYFEFVIYGNKHETQASVSKKIYNELLASIKSGGHLDYIKIKKTTAGAQITFKNYREAFVESYTVIGSGGSGGSGGASKTVMAGTSASTQYGAGGGGGEAGHKLTSTSKTRATAIYYEYTGTLGDVRLRAYNGSANTVNAYSPAGANGRSASYRSPGRGGRGRSNGAAGASGTTNSGSGSTYNPCNGTWTSGQKGGMGGAGGVITDSVFGHGGKGGRGSGSSSGGGSAGQRGYGWYIKVKISYSIYL